MRNRLLAFAAVAVVISAHTADAQRGRGGAPGRGGGPPGARCAQSADSLTDAQKSQVKVLADAFTNAHKSSLDSLRAIIETGRPINEALAPARAEYMKAVEQILTPAQIAAGCIPPPPGGPIGGRRGGPPS